MLLKKCQDTNLIMNNACLQNHFLPKFRMIITGTREVFLSRFHMNDETEIGSERRIITSLFHEHDITRKIANTSKPRAISHDFNDHLMRLSDLICDFAC